MATKNIESVLEVIGGMSALELADLSKAIQDKFGVSAVMPVAATGVAAEAASGKPEEKTQFKVTLASAGEKKIEVIKALRKADPKLGLSEAKNMVESTPSVIAESASKEDAERIKKELEAAGAKVELA